jgi:hypothetical protein
MITEDGKENVAVELLETPLLSHHSEHDQPYVLRFRTPDGHEHRVAAELLHNFPFGFMGISEIALGYDPEASSHCLFEAQTRFDWDSEIGYGLTERSIRTP